MILNDYKIDYLPYTLPNKEPIRIITAQDGEKLLSLKTFFGYTHKGIEKILTTIKYRDIPYYMEHINNFDNISVPYNYIYLVEKALNIDVSQKTKYIRAILLELSRIKEHLKSLSDIAFLLDIGEMLKSTKYAIKLINSALNTDNGSVITFGSINQKFNNDFVSYISKLLKNDLRNIIKILGNTFKRNSFLKKRLDGLGIVSKNDAINYGLSGVNLRACGIKYDVRTAEPYGVYSDLVPYVPVGTNGDAFTRYKLRLEEIFSSFLLINDAIEKFKNEKESRQEILNDILIPDGIYEMSTETAYGEYIIKIWADKKYTPQKVKMTSPSLSALLLFEKTAISHFVSDIPVILNSFDIAFTEIDK